MRSSVTMLLAVSALWCRQESAALSASPTLGLEEEEEEGRGASAEEKSLRVRKENLETSPS